MQNSRLAAALILIPVISTVTADTVYQWTDADGRSHYGDIPPQRSHTVTRNIDIDSTSRSPATGLRPAEKKRIMQLQQRADNRRQAQQQNRQRIRQQLADKQQACQEARSHMRKTRDAELRKRHASVLRQNCW